MNAFTVLRRLFLRALTWAWFGLLLSVGLAPALFAADKPLEIKLVTLAPRGTTVHLLLLKMAEQWQKASAGQVKLIVYPDYTQGGEAAMVDKMGIGGIDAALMTIVGLAKIDSGVTALATMPMMFSSLQEVDFVGEKLQPDLAERMGKQGYAVLFWTDIGWLRFFSVRPMLTPEDMKKMKVFVWAGNTAQVDIMKDAGFDPVSLEPSNILTALQTWMINVVPATPFSANAGQFTLKTKHMLELDWAPLVGGAVIRKKTWEKVPAATQQELLASAADIGRQIKAAGRKESDDAVKAMREKQGLEVHPVSRDMAQQWRKTAEAVYPRIRGRLVPAEMWDKVVAALKESRAAKGQTT